MASLGQSFDPNAVAPSTGGGGGVHPAGIFEFEINESDVKPNNKGTGLVLKFVAEGTGNAEAPSDNKGKKVFGNINVTNESAQAQTIGQGELSALCAAIGYTSALEDSEALHYQPFWAEIVHEPRMKKDSFGKYTIPDYESDGVTPKVNAVIKKYMFEGMDDAKPAAPTPPAGKPAAQAAPAQTAAPAGGRSWQRKT